MKPYAILLAGTISLVAALLKLIVGLPLDWVWVVLPLWAPMLFAYGAFVWFIVHALGMGKLEIVKPEAVPAPGDPIAPVVPIKP